MSKRSRAVVFMLVLALVSILIHFWAGWEAAQDEASMHRQQADFAEYLVQWTQDTFENLQSEFVQLAVQLAVLAGLFRFLGVHAFEEDQEEVKAKLSELDRKISEMVR